MTKWRVAKYILKHKECNFMSCIYCPCFDPINTKCIAHNGLYVDAEKRAEVCGRYIKERQEAKNA